MQVLGREHGEPLWSWSQGTEVTTVSLPDASGQLPRVVDCDHELIAFAPGEQPVPVEHAVITGHVYSLSPKIKASLLNLRIGQIKVRIDARGNLRVVLDARGTPALRADVGIGFIRPHGADYAGCLSFESQGCEVLIPLTGRGSYRVDLDVKVNPNCGGECGSGSAVRDVNPRALSASIYTYRKGFLRRRHPTRRT